MFKASVNQFLSFGDTMHRLRFVLFVLLISSSASAQVLSRTEKIEKVIELRSQIKTLEEHILMPDPKDIWAALKQDLNAFRLMPREKYDNVLTIRGGGAYYSFSRKVQEYGHGSDISLEQGSLQVGFAGANYGFICDLGKVLLSEVTRDTREALFLVTYRPPTNLPDIRAEQRRSRSYDVDGLIYRRDVPSTVEHTYLLRSIDFESSDTLVAFTVHRKDPDGSLIIFWKIIESFEIPRINRAQQE
jgi:hypothetical protein